MIPKVIHQTWKTSEVPDRLRRFADTWRSHHPDWEYRLWTDEDLRSLIVTHYPEFLAIFDGYKQPIKRVDAARYLILRTFGGLYADLDFECFKPIDPLLEGATCAIGLEPDEHLQYSMSIIRGMKRILCPSLLASIPGHPYWDVVYENLRYYHEVTHVLDATGPFLLTRCLDEMKHPETVRLLPAREVYPFGFERWKSGDSFDFERWDDLTRDATAMHHWEGTWVVGDLQQWTPGGASAVPDFVPIWMHEQTVVHPELRDAAISNDERVTAVMTTRGRSDKAKLAIDCFRYQTHSNKELVIVDAGPNDTLASHVAELADPSIKIIRAPEALRDVAIEAATGDYVIRWDDDALYHALRIAISLGHLRHARAQAAFVSRSLSWWVAERRFALGEHRREDGSWICRKDRAPRGLDDDAFARELARTTCYVELDLPKLCLYAATTDQPWSRAERRYEGLHAERVYNHLVHDFPLDAYARTA